MTAVALVFPGQGSQAEGMARPWADHPATVHWTKADETLDRDVSRLGFDAPADELREPAKCQLALFVHHIVLLEAWRAAGGAEPVAVAGHSLGEYDALVAAGVLDFADGLRLVDARAERTQQAADAAPGSMVACLGFDVDIVAEACTQAGAYVANDNAPGQIVAAGSSEALARLTERLGSEGTTSRGKVRPLKVGAAYHSPHMEAAVEPFGRSLDSATFADARVPVVANVDAQPHTAAGEWPDLLRRQLTAPVRWRETVTTLAGLGVDEVVELGASPVLTGLVKRSDRSLGRRTVSLPDDLRGMTASGAGA
ncbi:MAG: ACP S-malonyltransferase [Actinomycetota bacterium]|nr:ACP S-malonyltransferase [Euzebyaceae bacterium]MDQ3453715.1 ACP S-malonyltransferase [Actinomycetota bacterium]